MGGHSCVCPSGTQDIDGVCEASEVDYMSCSADESKKVCADFDSKQHNIGDDLVCGISDLPDGVGCLR